MTSFHPLDAGALASWWYARAARFDRAGPVGGAVEAGGGGGRTGGCPSFNFICCTWFSKPVLAGAGLGRGCGVLAAGRGTGERDGGIPGRIPGAGERGGRMGRVPGAGERGGIGDRLGGAGERGGGGRAPGAGDRDGIGLPAAAGGPGRAPGAGEREGGMGLRRPLSAGGAPGRTAMPVGGPGRGAGGRPWLVTIPFPGGGGLGEVPRKEGGRGSMAHLPRQWRRQRSHADHGRCYPRQLTRVGRTLISNGTHPGRASAVHPPWRRACPGW